MTAELRSGGVQARAPNFRPAILIMGVSGSGKTTLGESVAGELSIPFVEGDTLHPAANVAKMRAGVPLQDEDRWPWLMRLADVLREESGRQGCVASCSALKRSYRNLIRDRVGGYLLVVYPEVDPATLRQRLVGRPDHYMPASLLDSQLDTLEVPEVEENVLRVDGTSPLSTATGEVLKRLLAGGAL